jgi:hypothetical protein
MTYFEFRTLANHRLPFPVSHLIESIKLLTGNNPSWFAIIRNRNPGSIYKTVLSKLCSWEIPSFPMQNEQKKSTDK